jgi:hypothetical protein
MKKMYTFAFVIFGFLACLGIVAWTEKPTQQQKTYTLTLTAQETQVVYDALGELPAKTSESIRAKIAQQVTSQNQTTDKK